MIARRGLLFALALGLAVQVAVQAPSAADDELDLEVGLVTGVGGEVRSGLGLGVPGRQGATQVEVSVREVAWLAYPVVGVFGSHLQPNGGICRDTAWQRLDAGQSRTLALLRAERDYAAQFGLTGPHAGLDPNHPCPVDRPKLDQAAAQEITRRYVRSDQLPRPQLSVPPGHGLAGLPAYLVTGHQLEHHLPAIDVDLGLVQTTLTWTAQATMQVDWGDGTVTTHDRPGTAWPDGQVTHTYTDAGAYTITVTDTWTVTYEIDEVTGTLTETLQPVVLDTFEVHEHIAVRTTP